MLALKRIEPKLTVNRANSYKKVILGHSFGGLISSFILTHYPDVFDCAILVCPFLGLWPSIPCMTYDFLVRKPLKKKNCVNVCLAETYDVNL